MATTVSNLGRGNYVLGGLGAVRGPSAADAMIENQQEARAAREAELLAQQRRQQMQLAQSQEARAQATFAQQQEAYRRQQAAAAEARNRAALVRQAQEEFLRRRPVGLTLPTTATPAAAPPPASARVSPLAFDALPQIPDTPEDEAYRLQRGGPPKVRPVARPERPVAPVPGATGVPGVEPLSMGLQPIGPVGTPGVQVASLDPMEAFRVAAADLYGGAGTRVADLSGGAGTQVADDLSTEQPIRLTRGRTEIDFFPESLRIVNAQTGEEVPFDPRTDFLRRSIYLQAGMDELAGPTPNPPTEQPVRVDYNGYLFDVFPNSNRVLDYSGQEYPDVPGYAELRAALFQLAGDPASAAGDDGYDLGDAIDLDVMANELVNSGQATPEQVDQYVAKVGWANAIEQLRAAQGGLPPELQLIVAQGPAPAVGDVTTLPYTPQPAAQGPGLTIPTPSVQGPFVPPGLPAAPAAGDVPAVGAPPTPASAAGAAPAAVEAPGIRAVNPQASALVQDVQGILRQGDIASAVMRIQDGLARGVYGPMGSPIGRAIGYAFDSPEEAELRTAVRETAQWFKDPRSLRFLEANPDLLAEAAADPISFVNRIGEPPAPPAPEPEPEPEPEPAVAGMFEAPEQPAAPERPTTPERLVTPEATSGLTLTPPAAQEINTVAAQTGGDISRFYLRNPASVLQTADNAYRDIQRWESLVQYYQQIGDMTGMVEAEIGLGQARQAFSDMSGQLALAGLQLDNYGPLQLYLQQLYPGGTVEVRPYTDGSVEVFVDGNSIRRDYKNDLLEVLANSFNEEYRAGQAAQAALAAELRNQIFEQELETTGAIALERIQQQGRVDLKLLEAELSRLEGAGDVSLKEVTDPTGQNRPIFEYRVGGMRPRYIIFREIPSDSGEPLLQYDFVPLPGSE